MRVQKSILDVNLFKQIFLFKSSDFFDLKDVGKTSNIKTNSKNGNIIETAYSKWYYDFHAKG